MTLHSFRHWTLFVTGGLLLKAGRWRAAASLLERAVRLNPDHALSHSGRAIALLKLGRWEEAAAAFHCAVSLDPALGEARANLVIALLHLARWDEAISVCARAIELDPNRASLHEHLGIALLKLERWSPAADALRRALALDPKSANANSLLALALTRLEQGGAVEALRRAIELDPTSAKLHADLGAALGELESWEEAAKSFHDSLTLDPTHSEGYVSLASVLARPAASVERVLVAQQAMASAPNEAARHLDIGIELSKLERWDEAAAALQRGGSLAPDVGVFQYLLVNPLLWLGRFQEALAAYRRAAALGGARPCLPGELPTTRVARWRDSLWTKRSLGAEVFRIDGWVARLAMPTEPAASPSADEPRLMFILDNDYGELTTLMYLVLGQPLYARTTLLLPDRLFEKNSDALPGQTHKYTSTDDILQAVDRDRPHVVFLCSGYLMPIHRLCSIEELALLVKTLRERGCQVATADPFLGMLSKQDPRKLVTIEIPRRVDDDPVMQHLIQSKNSEEERLWTTFTACERIFRDAPHLYPAYCDVPPHQITSTDARNLSFFNAKLICPEIASRPAPKPTDPPHGPRHHWLFILSQTDYDTQQLFGDPIVFIDIVAEKLLDTLAAGRTPILIGPKELVNALVARMPTSEGVYVVAYCPFDRFMSLLLSAEYAFYWNVLSHSLLIRMFNKLPTIVFDRGHLVRNVPGMYERVVQWYYQGWEPTLVSHRESLTLESVSKWAEPYQHNADRILERFRRAPTPEEMINGLLIGDAQFEPAVQTGRDLGR